MEVGRIHAVRVGARDVAPAAQHLVDPGAVVVGQPVGHGGGALDVQVDHRAAWKPLPERLLGGIAGVAASLLGGEACARADDPVERPVGRQRLPLEDLLPDVDGLRLPSQRLDPPPLPNPRAVPAAGRRQVEADPPVRRERLRPLRAARTGENDPKCPNFWTFNPDRIATLTGAPLPEYVKKFARKAGMIFTVALASAGRTACRLAKGRCPPPRFLRAGRGPRRRSRNPAKGTSAAMPDARPAALPGAPPSHRHIGGAALRVVAVFFLFSLAWLVGSDLLLFGLAEEARSALRKVAFDLEVDDLEGAPVLYVDRPGAAEVRDRMALLTDAVRSRKKVRFTYHGIYRGEPTERNVAATERLLERARTVGERTLVRAGSALA